MRLRRFVLPGVIVCAFALFLGTGVRSVSDASPLQGSATGGEHWAREDPEGLGTLTRQGIEAYETMEFDRAMELLDLAGQEEGIRPEESATIRKYRAFVLIARGERTQARNEFLEALRENPSLRLDPLLRSDGILDVFRAARALFDAERARSDREAPVISAAAPAEAAVAGASVRVTVRIRDNGRVASAELYFRDSDNVEFRSVPMDALEEDLFHAWIPETFVRAPVLEYYILAGDDAGNLSYEGTRQAPLSATVKQGVVTRPWYKKWWVWTIAAVVVAGGVAGGVVAGTSDRRPAAPASVNVTVAIPALP